MAFDHEVLTYTTEFILFITYVITELKALSYALIAGKTIRKSAGKLHLLNFMNKYFLYFRFLFPSPSASDLPLSGKRCKV